MTDVVRAAAVLESLVLNRGIAKSRNARSFRGNNRWPVYMRLIGIEAGSNFLSAIASAPALIASSI